MCDFVLELRMTVNLVHVNEVIAAAGSLVMMIRSNVNRYIDFDFLLLLNFTMCQACLAYNIDLLAHKEVLLKFLSRRGFVLLLCVRSVQCLAQYWIIQAVL